MNNYYASKGWRLPVNKYKIWERFKLDGFYEPANDYEPEF